MTDITLSDTQAAAVREIKDWFNNRTEEQQVFRLFGYAGVGKTTVIKHAIAELGIEEERIEDCPACKGPGTLPVFVLNDISPSKLTEPCSKCEGKGKITHRPNAVLPLVRYMAFTGKAAFVMRKHGTPAHTIHSSIYSVSEATEEEIARARKRLTELEEHASTLSGAERILAEAVVRQEMMRIADMKRPIFHLNTESDVRDCDLIVLDEVSMVGPDIAADILSFGKPTLVIGDPGQLPPIKGEGTFTQQDPDVLLTEIHRQAAESAIIRLATMARNSQFIPYGEHDENVWKLSRRQIEPQQLLKASQVICGKNLTRLELNNAMRRANNLTGSLPVGPEEKIICLRNQNDLGLINGMFLSLNKVEPINEERFRAVITTEEGKLISNADRKGNPQPLEIYAGHFLDHEIVDHERGDRDWKIKKRLIECTFGYAVTCHKSQGSQWPRIIVWDDGLGRTREDRARWLYTACTRAEEGLLLLD